MADTATTTADNTAAKQTAAESTGTQTTAMPAAAAATDPVFTKEQLAASKKYIHKSDLVMAVLAEGKTYTIAQADAAIQAFLDKEVK
jgi:hypothetical protein